MDIDDILRDFDRQTRQKPLVESKLRENDLESLQKSWISERACPELLEYQTALLERILTRIRHQVEFIELNSIELQSHTVKDIKLQLMLVESELERVNFLIRGYLRTRLRKIDKFTLSIYNNEQSLKKLSPQELGYMDGHFKALSSLFNNQFLSHLPENLQPLDDTEGGISMIVEPDLEEAVFVRVLNTISNAVLVGNEEVELDQDGIYVMRYSSVRPHIHSGDVILI